jgi:hypothetical protein
MSARIVPAGHNQFIVVVRGWSFVTRSALLTKPEAIHLAAQLSFKGVRK